MQEENKTKLLQKIAKTDDRIKEIKEKQDEENKLNYNKMYMSREEKKARVERSERVQSII